MTLECLVAGMLEEVFNEEEEKEDGGSLDLTW
jgi:hypothetical protein